MSLWLYRKEQNGRKTVTSVSVPFELIFVLVGLLSAIIIPRLLSKDIRAVAVESLSLMIVGFLLFAISKVMMFRKGLWFSWGTKQMPKAGKYLYTAGYILMVMGILL